MFFPLSDSKYWAKIWNIGISTTSDHIQIKIKMPNPSQEPPDPTKAPNQNFKDMDVLCTFKIKIESQHSESRCIKDQWLYPNQNQDTKPHAGFSSKFLKSCPYIKHFSSKNSKMQKSYILSCAKTIQCPSWWDKVLPPENDKETPRKTKIQGSANWLESKRKWIKRPETNIADLGTN